MVDVVQAEDLGQDLSSCVEDDVDDGAGVGQGGVGGSDLLRGVSVVGA
ncbi:hypothetical protein [Actinoalloteichus sp. AHMU CJ021]